MRIARVRIENYRCLRAVTIGFDAVSTFIGPNGIGKSTILRALDWFFNGGPLTEDDRTAGVPDGASISVSVEFANLSASDKEALQALGIDEPTTTWTVTRRWVDGAASSWVATSVFDAFAEVRGIGGAMDQRRAYKSLQETMPALGLPNVSSQSAVHAALREWELGNPTRLTPGEVEIVHPFGFGNGSAFSGVFDYVLVDADLRAEEESADSRGSLINRILAHRVDRGPAGAAFAELAEAASGRHVEIVAEHLDPLLADLAEALTAGLNEFTRARAIRLRGTAPPLAPAKPTISVSVDAGGTETSVDRQGHGFRRALLIALLRFLASAVDNGDHVVMLAIEEPELFQHPSQAKVFARILRELGHGDNYQVAYATHSPYFIEARDFEQVRRLTLEAGSSGAPAVAVHQVSRAEVVGDLENLINVQGIQSRWSQVCTENLAEALFAEAALVVEGTGDKGVLEGLARRSGETPLEDLGVAVVDAHGKDGLLTPIAILRGLGIPVVAAYDTDSGLPERLAGKQDDYVEAAVTRNAKTNTAILKYFGANPDNPLVYGEISPTLFAFEDDLESVLASWPEWDEKRRELIADGRGAPKKNAPTYLLAATEADGEPPALLMQIINAVRGCADPN
ncbi:MAG: ATP-dependent nuclease [Marmoricola sp.]